MEQQLTLLWEDSGSDSEVDSEDNTSLETVEDEQLGVSRPKKIWRKGRSGSTCSRLSLCEDVVLDRERAATWDRGVQLEPNYAVELRRPHHASPTLRSPLNSILRSAKPLDLSFVSPPSVWVNILSEFTYAAVRVANMSWGFPALSGVLNLESDEDSDDDDCIYGAGSDADRRSAHEC